MTLFDVIALLILLVSGLVGLIRGALREVMTVFAFIIAVLVSIFALRFTGPLARKAMDPDWAGNTAAVLIVFVAFYILIRVMGAGLQNKVHQTGSLGSVDRAVGVGFGLVRGLVMLGVFHLVFHAATPADRVPQWISGAALYPLSKTCAKALSKLVPEGSAVAGRLTPHLQDAVREGASDPNTDEAATTDGTTESER
jgi:membrane protein required for colicin V production